jgi:hypothetical protein
LPASIEDWDELAVLAKVDCDSPVCPALLAEEISFVDVEDCFCLCDDDGDERAADEREDGRFLLEGEMILLLLGGIIPIGQWWPRSSRSIV